MEAVCPLLIHLLSLSGSHSSTCDAENVQLPPNPGDPTPSGDPTLFGDPTFKITAVTFTSSMMAVISIEVVRSTLQLLVLWYTLYSCMLFVSCSVKLRSKLITASVLPYKWVLEGDKPQFALPCMPPLLLPVLRYHLTAPCSQQDSTMSQLQELMVCLS